VVRLPMGGVVRLPMGGVVRRPMGGQPADRGRPVQVHVGPDGKHPVG
jgi:hypothetical protein